MPTDSDLSTGRSPGCSPGPSPGPELNTPCSQKSSRSHFPRTPSPSLSKLPVGPTSGAQHFLRVLPPPASVPQQTPDLNKPAGQHSYPRPLLVISRPTQSIAFIIDPLPWELQLLPAADSFERQQAPLRHVPTSQSSATPGLHPEPLSSLQASETAHSRDASPSRDGLPGVEKGAPSFPHTPLTSLL